jgi:hypothetical protein
MFQMQITWCASHSVPHFSAPDDLIWTEKLSDFPWADIGIFMTESKWKPGILKFSYTYKNTPENTKHHITDIGIMVIWPARIVKICIKYSLMREYPSLVIMVVVWKAYLL